MWSLHPSLLDQKGLVALWRESLLAQAVLAGRTRGYRNHPQLDRFRSSRDPLLLIRRYLLAVLDEAQCRHYAFDPTRIDNYESLSAHVTKREVLAVTAGQLDYEWRLLMTKLARRDPHTLMLLRRTGRPHPHPLFQVVEGPVEPWERVKELPREVGEGGRDCGNSKAGNTRLKGS
ncbi:MAG TPA: pyrimidine dimer DNA glycosylase/endonuclease V [Spirochaetia bacterium]|nr:pyrimidine dimer DNA glycosylase/endonuclease V [Spirochaetia bacterium]